MGQAGGNPNQLSQHPERLHCSSNSQLRNHSKPLSVSLPMPGSGRTLRETVLESSPILALLNESFISSWSLVKELEELQVSVTTSLPLHSRCSRCLAGVCQQERGAHCGQCEDVPVGGWRFQACFVIAIAGAKPTADGGRLRKWCSDPLRSGMVPVLKAKPDASLKTALPKALCAINMLTSL